MYVNDCWLPIPRPHNVGYQFLARTMWATNSSSAQCGLPIPRPHKVKSKLADSMSFLSALVSVFPKYRFVMDVEVTEMKVGATKMDASVNYAVKFSIKVPCSSWRLTG